MSEAKIAVVTGISSGIGRASAAELARRGFRVFGTVRTAGGADLPGVTPIVLDYLRRYPETDANCWFVDRVVNLVDEGIDVEVLPVCPHIDERFALAEIDRGPHERHRLDSLGIQRGKHRRQGPAHAVAEKVKILAIVGAQHEVDVAQGRAIC